MASYYAHWQQNFWLDTFWPEELWYSDDATYAGSISVTLADLAPAFIGSSAEPGATDGFIASTLGPLLGSIPGTVATTILFDLPVNISVNWQVQDQGYALGDIDATLDDLTSAFSGIAWEQSYTDGRIEGQSLFWAAMFWGDVWTPEFWLTSPQLDGVTAAFEGTLLDPGAYVGVLSAALEGDTSTFLGATYLPANFNGHIFSQLGGVSGSLAGTHVDPTQTGVLSSALDDVTGLIQAQSIEAGSTIGRLAATLGGVSPFEWYGQVFISQRTGLIPNVSLDDLSSSVLGLALPVGAKWGPLRSSLGGVGAVFAGTHQSPRARSKADVPQVSEIDWKTLCDQHNAGLPKDPDYEFSNNRRFYQG